MASNPTRPSSRSRSDKADDPSDFKEFVRRCTEKLGDKLLSEIQQSRAEIQQLRTKLDASEAARVQSEAELNEKIKALQQQLEAREAHYKLELARVEGKARFAMDEAMDREERDERAPNVMVRGVGVAANSSQEVLKQEVVKALKEAATDLALVTDEIEEVVRLSPALLKVRFKDTRTRRKVFRKRHTIRTASGNKLKVVQEDLTRLQQANVRRLQPVFEVLRDEARAEAGRWGPYFRGGLLWHHVGPVAPDQPQRAELHEANWDPTVLAAAMHARTLAAAGQPGPSTSAPQQGA